MKLSIVTPESLVFSGDVENVVLPGADGEMEVLPMHAALVSLLQPGEISFHHEGSTQYMVVGDGFIEVSQNEVTVMTDMAAREEDIDESVEIDAVERAREAISKADTTPEEAAAVHAHIAKNMARIEFKRRRRSRV